MPQEKDLEEEATSSVVLPGVGVFYRVLRHWERRDATEWTSTIWASDRRGVRVVVSTDTLATHPTDGHSIHSEFFV